MKKVTFTFGKFFAFITVLLLSFIFVSENNDLSAVSADEVKYIINTDANVREQAKKESNLITVLNRGTVVTVVDTEGDYSKIILSHSEEAASLSSSNEIAYVWTKYLTKGTELPAEEKTSVNSKKLKSTTKGSQVVNYAKKFVGNPYRYGGTSLTKGADCSGFVMSVYKHFGYKLPRTSYAQRKVGKKVSSLSAAKPGDIICYSGHVAIYMGNNKIVHASTRKTGIKISNNAKYRKIVTIRRVV